MNLSLEFQIGKPTSWWLNTISTAPNMHWNEMMQPQAQSVEMSTFHQTSLMWQLQDVTIFFIFCIFCNLAQPAFQSLIDC